VVQAGPWPGAHGKVGPPAPPSKRPVGRKPAPPAAPRDSGYSGSGSGMSESSTPRESGGSIAGGLAEALRQRQAAMTSKKEDDEDEW